MKGEREVEIVSKKIFGKEYKDKLDQKILNNKILWLVFVLLFSWNTFMQISLSNIKDENHVKVQFPALNYVEGEQIVGKDFANDEYFLAWGMYQIINLSKFDKKNVKSKLTNITSMMPSKLYAKKSSEIEEFLKTVYKNEIKADFRIPNDQWTVSHKKENEFGSKVVRIIAKGDVFKRYGTNYSDPQKECEYFIDYFRKGGYTYVQDFGTTCF